MDRLTLLHLPANVHRKCSRIELTSTRNLLGNLAFPFFNHRPSFPLRFTLNTADGGCRFLRRVTNLQHNPILLRVISSTFHSDRLWGT